MFHTCLYLKLKLFFCFTEIFRAAAEAGPHDILKLYNTRDNIVNISPKLPENSPQTRYQLEVVAASYSGRLQLYIISDGEGGHKETVSLRAMYVGPI